MRKNLNGYITINDFVDVILEAEESLQDKINNSKTLYEE
jgi:hypothetical protein